MRTTKMTRPLLCLGKLRNLLPDLLLQFSDSQLLQNQEHLCLEFSEEAMIQKKKDQATV